MRVSIHEARQAGIHGQIQGLFSLRFPWESVVSCALTPIPSQALPLDFGDLLSPVPDPEAWLHPKFPARRTILRVQPPILVARGARRGRSRSRPGRERTEKPKQIPILFFSFPSFPPFPPFLAHLELPPWLFPRRRHLAPGLFFPSLFGSAPSSRTNAAPINNRGSCSLPLPPSLGSVFLSPCLSLLLPGGDAGKSRSGG